MNKIKSIWKNYKSEPQKLRLPLAPNNPIIYMEDDNRPQPKLDLNIDKGMAVCVGRLSKDVFFDFKYIGLSHNIIRGAAGGAILLAELLLKKGYINSN